MRPLSIKLYQVSKKFNRQYLYKDITIDIAFQDKLAVTGNNGSGKSTLLKIMSGHTSPTDGSVEYYEGHQKIEKQIWHQYISIAAPYMNTIEEFTTTELVSHLLVFRKFQVDYFQMQELLELQNHTNKPIKYFSSGMKQRVRLWLAILDAAPILLLDEPCSNLDAKSVKWYEKMIQQFAMNKTIIVFTNSQPSEYFFCSKTFALSQ
ncbi:MAG: ATP-binding cassette domain-containing protein [Bacteroidia bacterium]|nr:ATP-binding cassette domain-containing protein [Bacteroidia bacterium]